MAQLTEVAKQLDGPDLASGIELSKLADRAMLLGHAHGEAVLLARCGQDIFAIGAHCTHYGAPLAEGMLVGDTVRCPWHHACFSLRTGEALRAPALDPVACWRVEQRDGVVYVRRSRSTARSRPRTRRATAQPQVDRHRGRRRGRQCGCRDAAARRLFRRHHDAERRCIAAVRSAQPVEGVSRRHGTRRVESAALVGVLPRAARSTCNWMRPSRRSIRTTGACNSWTAAPCVRCAAARDRRRAGASRRAGCHVCGTCITCARLPTAARWSPSAQTSRRAVVIGASFIGLEVAASLRARNIDVHVVAPDTIPDGEDPGPRTSGGSCATSTSATA